MLFELILAASLLFASYPPQTQSGSGSSATMPATLPIKMGLWENKLTTSEGETQKTRSCFTRDSFERSVANVPPSCSISKQVWTSHSYASDIACSTPTSHSTGHLDMQFPGPETARSTIAITMTVQGKTIPLTITTDSHFISSKCGDLGPGQSRELQ